jgi:peptidyl-tRNA hydrolase
MTGTPILPKEEKKVRQVSKGLSVKDKNKMCSIMGFLLYLKESGKMEETEAKRLMEELPLYSISRIQTEFFGQDAFDLKKVEVELWKPMVVENKLNKKNKKNEEKEKPKKERKSKKNSSSDDVVVDDATKKRGRKAKKQIIEFENTNTIVKEDQLEELLNEMLEEEEEKVVKQVVNEEDLDAVLRELEEGELVEEKMEEVVVVPVPNQPVKVKKDKKTTKKEEPVVEDDDEPKKEEDKKVNNNKKKNNKKVKISE